MKKFALVGKPIMHSKSPELFKKAYQNDNFEYLLLETTDLKYIESLLRNKVLAGINVTLPLKIEAMQLVDEIDETAKIIDATNTIILQGNNNLKAYNTDYLGVMNTLLELEIDVKNQNCLIIGAGGAARAAALALSMLGANITIANRTFHNAKKISEKLNCQTLLLYEINNNLKYNKLIVNTLSPDICAIDEKKLQSHQIVFDAKVYQSVFLQKARRQGCKCIDGRLWLLHQGIESYRLFTEKDPDVCAMRNFLNI